MSAEETRAEHPEEKSPRRQRLRLIDIYTNRGAFRGDELRGIAERAREITVPSPASRPLPDTEEQRAFGDPNGEPSGGARGEPSGARQHTQPLYPIESADGSVPERFGQSATAPFIQPPHHSPHQTPDSSPYNSPHQTPDSSPYNSPSVALTENQAILYFCLKQLNGAATNLSRISQATGVSEHTLKSCLKKLRQEGLIQHGGRQQFKGMTGFSATVIFRDVSLQGDGHRLSRRLQQIDYTALPLTARLTPLYPNTQFIEFSHPTIHPTDPPTAHPAIHLTAHQTVHQEESTSCSSRKEQLLQDLLLEDAFQDLNPRSLLPYLEQFETTDALQNFLDMANACIATAKDGRGKPIQNPHGFLFAQLKVGYSQSSEGYKSRKVRAQEHKNRQLEEELETLRRLKEREQELRFALFAGQLTVEEQERLERDARAQINPNIGMSTKLQIEIHKEAILKQWFTQHATTAQTPQEDA